jgi:plastocyanin
MRLSMVAAVLLAVTGCVVGDAAIDGDDDGTGSNPGNGSNQPPPPPTPRLDLTVDRPAMATELMTTNMITVTARAANGFSGQVALTAAVTDAAGAAMTGWTIALDTATIDVPLDGMATAVATLKIPALNTGLAATLKIGATSSLGAHTAQSTVDVVNQVTYAMVLNNGLCVYPPNGVTNIKVGTKVRWLNTDTQNRITIHMDRPVRDGLVHQDDPGSAPGAAYERTTALNGDGQLSGQAMSWYCHAPGPDTGAAHQLRVVP